jgi:hypothetical protein
LCEPAGRDFSAFLQQCLEELEQRQKAFVDTWGIDQCERWDVDQTQATITFTNTRKGFRKLSGQVQIIGTFRESDQMWFWAWANPSIAEKLTEDARRLRDYGQQHLRMRLTEGGWKGDLQDAWKMTALAAHLSGADVVYRGPAGDQFVFMTIRELKNAG